MKRKLLKLLSIFKNCLCVGAVIFNSIWIFVFIWLSIFYIKPHKTIIAALTPSTPVGQIAKEYEFSKIGTCDDVNQIVVRKVLKCGIIENGGLVILEPKYDFISSYISLRSGLREFEDKGLCGLLDINGNVILEPKYDDVEVNDFEGVIEVRKGMIYKEYKLEDLIKS